MFYHYAHCAFPDLWGISIYFAHHSNPLRFGVSGKPGAVQYCYIGAFVGDRVESFSSDVVAHVTNGRREILTEDSLLAEYVTKYRYVDDMGKQEVD
jgi:hypothetical protein